MFILKNYLWKHTYRNLYKLSIHFGEDKTKSILFSSKLKVKNARSLNFQYKNIQIKQYSKVTYLGCILDETLSGDSMALHVINKVYPQNKFLNTPLRRLLCNALIQYFIDYAYNAWYPNLNKKLKSVCRLLKINPLDSV